MTPDALFVGGGLIGLASAWQVARAGLQVTVFDPAPGAAASNVAAGMLAPVTEVVYGEEDRLALNVAAARRWPAFAAELEAATGTDVGYCATGTLLVGFDRDDVAALSDLHAFQTELGLGVEQLRSREARAREPMLSPRVRVGLLAGEDHRVEPRACVAALLRACADAGVVFERRQVARVERRGDRVIGVRTADGEQHHADQVVLSAGAWAATIDGLDAERPAVRPVKGQLLHLRDPSGRQVLRTTVRGLVRHRSVYLVPRDDGRLVVGASQEERGFDTTVTAGATRELLDDAATIVPGVDELELVETIAGLRPTTPDNTPLIGPGPLDGLVLATGHHRNGVLLAPITAEAIAATLTGAEVDPVLAVAHPARAGATT
ncbi:MAG: glycine oxidase ThiO [Nitriliruptor sp.]